MDPPTWGRSWGRVLNSGEVPFRVLYLMERLEQYLDGSWSMKSSRWIFARQICASKRQCKAMWNLVEQMMTEDTKAAIWLSPLFSPWHPFMRRWFHGHFSLPYSQNNRTLKGWDRISLFFTGKISPESKTRNFKMKCFLKVFNRQIPIVDFQCVASSMQIPTNTHNWH